jgi:hypothetical protein
MSPVTDRAHPPRWREALGRLGDLAVRQRPWPASPTPTIRMQLVPSIKEYVDLLITERRSLPYVVFGNPPNYRTTAITTDAGGFRISHSTAGPYSVRRKLADRRTSVILGASPAFGYGASHDDRTIPSLLASTCDDVQWLNMAVPAFNSTQEVLLLMLHQHELPPLEDVVVLSGFNDLAVTGLSIPAGSATEYQQFFFSGEHVQGPRSGAEEQLPPPLTIEQRIDIAVQHTARNLDRLLALAPDSRVHYALQPTLPWTNKSITWQEQTLMADIERRDGLWGLYEPILDRGVYREYARRLAAMCQQRGLPFLDTNPIVEESPMSDGWLFIDHVHLTDEGHSVVADGLRTHLARSR